MGTIASLFGYVLNFLYNLVQNYGLAIIIFTVLLKLILLPLSIRQQKSMKKSAKLQEEMNKLQVKYKNNPELLNQEVMDLYKREKVSPFSGCLTSILQFIIFLSVFYLVSRPLTYMKKVEPEVIKNYTSEITENGENTSYPEIKIIESKSAEDERVRLNMNFLGLDLSKVPMQNASDIKVFIIPALYVLVTFINIKITTNMSKKKSKKNKAESSDDKKKTIDANSTEKDENTNKKESKKSGKSAKNKNEKLNIKEDKVVEKIEKNNKKTKVEEEETPEDQMESMQQMTNSMNWMIPIMSVAVALIAPLGLSLYWLVSNILQFLERIAVDLFVNKKEVKDGEK